MTRTDVVSAQLLVLAHQDDEYFALPWICDALERGMRVLVAVLTDGGSRTDPATRDSETLSALLSLGVSESDILFAGTDEGIGDGKLAYSIDAAFAALTRWLTEKGITLAEILSPDWEGGHQDHDAAHAVAAAVALRFGASGWGFSLYNAFNTPAPLFRVLHPLPATNRRVIKYGFRRSLFYAGFCWRYTSQRKTWIGLFPEALLKRVISRHETVNALRYERIGRRPHDGTLLYERMFGERFENIGPMITRFFTRQASLRGTEPVSAPVDE